MFITEYFVIIMNMFENSHSPQKTTLSLAPSPSYLPSNMRCSIDNDGSRVSKLYIYDWTLSNYDMMILKPDSAISPDFVIGINHEAKFSISLSPSSDNNLKIEIILSRNNTADMSKADNTTFAKATLNLEFLDSKKNVLDYYIALPSTCKYVNKLKHYHWEKEENISRFIDNNSLTICAKISLSYPLPNLKSDEPCSNSLAILANDMKKLIGNSSFADIVVIVGGQRFFAHKAILLPQLFHSGNSDSKLNAKMSVISAEKSIDNVTDTLNRNYEVIYIENENSDIFFSILHYFYTGKFPISDVNDFGLYGFSKKYHLNELCKCLTPDKMFSSSLVKSSKVIFFWHVEDYSIRSLNKFNLLRSPEYKLLVGNKEIMWNVSLFFFDLKNIFLSLQRNVGCDEDVQAVFKLAVCGPDGIPNQECEYKHLFTNTMGSCYPGFLDPESRFSVDSTLLYDDTLTIQCELSVSDGELISDSFLTHAGEFAKLNFKYWFKNLQNLLENKKYSDVTLIVEEQEFKVHKCILSARSPVFARMLECDMTEKISGCIKIEDISSAAMECAINFIYTGKLENLLMVNAPELYRAADKYEMIDLRDRCTEFILANLDADSACEVLILADLYNDTKMKSAAKNLICKRANLALMTSYGLELMTNHPHLANDILENLSAVFCSLPPQDAYLNASMRE